MSDSSNVIAAVMSCSESVSSPEEVAQDPIHSTVESVNHVSNVDITVSRIQRMRMIGKAGQCTEVVRVGSDHSQQFDEPEKSNNDVSNVDVQLGRRRRWRTTMKRSSE